MHRWDTVYVNLRLATMDPARTGAYGALGVEASDGALAIQDGRFAWLGTTDKLPVIDESKTTVVDGGGRWATPGLIDCHTHLVYGGNRAEEFELRLGGVDYQEIARRGGGILSTVKATRAAGEQELFAAAAKRVRSLLGQGVTGLEIKSGYGLDRDTELKMLRVARRIASECPVAVSATFLGAHALPPEYTDSDAYIDYLCATLLPEVAAESLADAVDVFCESIGFSLLQAERLLTSAKRLGLSVKIHAEQLSNMRGASLAARLGALSADHLEYLDADGVAAMQEAGTVAVLLPGAFYFLRETRKPPIEALRAAGVPMAIASDSNPGSSPLQSILLVLNMACTLFDMTPEEALSGVTRNAARALGWQSSRGTVEVGKRADLVLWDIEHIAELAYYLGGNPCHQVLSAGQTVVKND